MSEPVNHHEKCERHSDLLLDQWVSMKLERDLLLLENATLRKEMREERARAVFRPEGWRTPA